MLIIYSLPTCFFLLVDSLVDFSRPWLITNFYTTKLAFFIESPNQPLRYLQPHRKIFLVMQNVQYFQLLPIRQHVVFKIL